MVIYLQGDVDEEVKLDEMSPRQIVAELDKHVVGQRNAKRAVAIALRNRVRRQKLPPELAVDVMPKNIIMIGSTGVGKTEIARRLARMSNSPFLKVEASKFTEVGYVGRDVESMIRDLTEISVEMTRQEKSDEIAEKAELNVEERILDLLLPPPRAASSFFDFDADSATDTSTDVDQPERDEQFQKTREKLRTQLRSGKLDNRLIELEVREKSFPVIELAGPQGVEEMGINMRFYCNINMPPRFDGESLTYVDLDIDLLVEPDLSYRVLDLEDFEHNARHYNYPPNVKHEARRAVDELISMIQTRAFPFNVS